MRNWHLLLLADYSGLRGGQTQAAGLDHAIYLLFGDGDSGVRLFYLAFRGFGRPLGAKQCIHADSRVVGALLPGGFSGGLGFQE